MIKKILDFIKRLLDMLPLNGGKTLLGCILIILAAKFNVPNELLNPILHFLGLDLTTLGWIVGTTGVIHKIAKAVS